MPRAIISVGKIPGQKDRDDLAIRHLCRCLKSKSSRRHLSTVGPFDGSETWEDVINRRIAGRYPKEKMAHTEWFVRHFYLRQVFADGTADQTASYVASFWSEIGHPVMPVTVKSASERKSAKLKALKWIEDQKFQWLLLFHKPAPSIREVCAALNAGLESHAPLIALAAKVKRRPAKSRP